VGTAAGWSRKLPVGINQGKKVLVIQTYAAIVREIIGER